MPNPAIFVTCSDDKELAAAQLLEELEEPFLSKIKAIKTTHKLVFNDEKTCLVTSFFRINSLLADLSKAGFRVELGDELIAYFKEKVSKEDFATKLAENTMERMEKWSGRIFRPYQRIDIKWMHSVTCGINALQQRLGKTLEISAMMKQAGAIIIGPLASVDGWVKEIQLCRKDLRPVVVRNAAKFRWPKQGEVIILHYDAVPNTGLKRDKKGNMRPGLVHIKDACPQGLLLAFDECQWIKNPKAERTKRCQCLADIVGSNQGLRWLVTGTPVPNRRAELWEFLSFLRIATKLFPQGRDWFIKAGPEEDQYIATILSRHMVRRLRKDVIQELPHITREIVPVEVPQDCKNILDDMWKKAIERGILDNHEDLIEILKLDPDFMMYSKIRSALAKAKIPKMLDWVEEMTAAEEKAVIISAHKAPVEALGEVDGWAFIHGGVEPKLRQILVDDFKSGKLNGLGLTVKTGGMAIDLSISGYMLVVDQDWTPGNNAQAEDRIVNVSKSTPLLYRYLVIDHPLEMHVHNVLMFKQEQITRLDTVGNKCDDPSRSIKENKKILNEAMNQQNAIEAEKKASIGEDAFLEAFGN